MLAMFTLPHGPATYQGLRRGAGPLLALLLPRRLSVSSPSEPDQRALDVALHDQGSGRHPLDQQPILVRHPGGLDLDVVGTFGFANVGGGNPHGHILHSAESVCMRVRVKLLLQVVKRRRRKLEMMTVLVMGARLALGLCDPDASRIALVPVGHCAWVREEFRANRQIRA